MNSNSKCSSSKDPGTLFGTNGQANGDDSGKVFYKTTTLINDLANYCFCSSANSNDPYLRIWLSSAVSDVKTIIFVGYEGNSIPRVNFGVRVSSSESTGY
jgi:hypothetical protein